MVINLVAKLTLDDKMSSSLQRATRSVDAVEKAVKRTDGSINSATGSWKKSSSQLMSNAEKAANGIGRVEGRVGGLGGAFDSMAGRSTSSFSKITLAVGGVITALGSAVGAAKLLNATVGEAMRFEQSEVLVTAMLDDKNLAKQYTGMVQRLAEASPLMDSSTMMGSSKAFIGITKSMPALEKAWGIAEKLSIMDPEQGLEGAVYAMKELASGDGVSMAERFEMPKSVVNDIKKLNFNDQLKAMEKYLDKTGITSKTVEAMGGTTISKWNQVKEKLQSTFRTMGQGGNSALGDAMSGLLKGLDSGVFDNLAKSIDSSLGTALKKVTSWIADVNWQSVADGASTAFAGVVSAATLVWNAGKTIVDNWKPISDVLIAVTAAVATFKVGMAALSIISTVNTLMRAYQTTTLLGTAAQWALNVAMNANPMGLVITGISALVGAGILLYKNWDTVTAATKRLWDNIKNGKGAIFLVLGPIGQLIKTAIDLAKNWDSTKSVWDNVWGAMKRSAGDTVNSVIGGINKMINMINKIPGVNIPIVAKVDWGENPAAGSVASKTYSSGTSNNVGTSAHALGNHAGLGEVHGTTVRKLHDGERVLTAVENKALKAQANVEPTQTITQQKTDVNVSFSGATFAVREEADIEKIATELARKVSRHL